MGSSPTVHDILYRVPAGIACEMVVYQRAMIQLRDEEDLRAFLASVQHMLHQSPLVLAFFHGNHLRHHINLGWSEEWLERYQREKWGEIDPVMQQGAEKPINWSEALASAKRHGRRLSRWLDLCKAEDMTHGLTYIALRGEFKIVLSIQGTEVETSSNARLVIDGILGGIADVSYKILSQSDRLAQMTEKEAEIFRLMALDGMTEEETANIVGLSKSRVRQYMKNLRERYAARNTVHLLARIMSLA